MAVTVIHPRLGTQSGLSPTGTAFARYLVGPPSDPSAYNGQGQGRCVRQSGSSGSETYRWVVDEPTNTTSPQSFSYDIL